MITDQFKLNSHETDFRQIFVYGTIHLMKLFSPQKVNEDLIFDDVIVSKPFLLQQNEENGRPLLQSLFLILPVMYFQVLCPRLSQTKHVYQDKCQFQQNYFSCLSLVFQPQENNMRPLQLILNEIFSKGVFNLSPWKHIVWLAALTKFSNLSIIDSRDYQFWCKTNLARQVDKLLNLRG